MDLGVGNFLRSPETENESWMPWRHNSTVASASRPSGEKVACWPPPETPQTSIRRVAISVFLISRRMTSSPS